MKINAMYIKIRNGVHEIFHIFLSPVKAHQESQLFKHPPPQLFIKTKPKLRFIFLV